MEYLIESAYLFWNRIIPARPVSAERARLERDLLRLIPGKPLVAISGQGRSPIFRRLEFSDKKSSSGAVLVDGSVQEIFESLGAAIALKPDAVIAPVFFQEFRNGLPYFPELVDSLGRNGLSLFSLYDVKHRHGRIVSAYSLFVSTAIQSKISKNELA